ncbi:MAG: pyruvate, phosphate dikinase, partial [Chloroflexi bacterium]
MTPFVLPLSHPDAGLANVGGKGMSLAKLRAAGLPVPDGFHVTTAAYRQFVAHNGIQPRIVQTLGRIDPADTAALETASQQIRELFGRGETPPEISAAVAAAYTALHGAPVAVRSSATAEDLPGAS